MKNKIIILLFIVIIYSTTPSNKALAHPGNTDRYGCHTCRTNCSKWGRSYGEYHCHNSKPTIQNNKVKKNNKWWFF